MKTTIQEHGVMLSDYFHGTAGVWLNISPFEGMTKAQIIDELETEINMIWDHIEYTAEYHGADPDQVFEDLKGELEQMREYIKDKPPLYDLTDVELPEEDEEGPVLIFTIEFEED